ncbi:hypothetical protein GCM10022215_01100 [Nocardioides fonticola]|uniref:DUF11 domain-containing protein n=1 Tax=Nocardioides fonticola TaxID=450363 RepID=A0ABP7X9A9_9ACTN
MNLWGGIAGALTRARVTQQRRRTISSIVGVLAVMLASLTMVAVLPAGPAQAADRSFETRFSANDTGDIEMIGNTVMTCPGTLLCSSAQQAAASSRSNNNVNNNVFTMGYVDVDSDPTTFDSSSASLALPAGSTVLFAGLYWGGEVTAGAYGGDAPNQNARNTVKFKAPGDTGYSTLTASTLDDGDIIYQGFVDVTSRVAAAGNGSYTVANVQTATGQDRLGGWSLVIAYRDTTQPARNLTIFDGLKSINGSASGTIAISGFRTPPAGTVRTTVGFVTYEGDLGLVGDGASLNGVPLSDAQHPATNFFDSRSSRDGVLRTNANPSYANNLGFEQSMLTVGNSYLGNGDTSATIRLTTAGDVYAPGVVTFATELYAPKLEQTKTVTDLDGGVIEQGDRLRYTISGLNSGQDGAASFVLRDPVPADTTYVPGSIKVSPAGGTAAGVTDLAGDDLGEYDAAGNRVVARVGTGASSTVGGTVGVGGSYSVSFDVVVNGPSPAVPDGRTITNTATGSYASATLGTPLTVQSSVDAVVAAPDLRITKSHTGSIVRGSDVTYDLTVSNRGAAATQGVVTVTDALPAGLTYLDASGIGWACGQASGTVTCTRSDRLGAAATYPPIRVHVAVADPAPAQVANTAVVVGGGDGVPDDNSDVDAAPTVAVTGLGLAKSADPATVSVGDTTAWTLTVTNAGPSASTGSTIVDQLPDGLSFVSGSPGCVSGGTASQVVCEVGALTRGQQASVTIRTRADLGTAGATLTNSATVVAHEDDPDHTDDTATADLSVRPVDLAVTARIDGDPTTLTPGTPYTWLLDARNLGGSPAADSELRFTLPSGVTVDTGALDPRCHLDGSAGPGSTQVVCPLGTVAANATVPRVRVTATVGTPAPAVVEARATVSTTEPDVDVSNNTALTSTPTGGAGTASLSITKTADKASAAPGDQVTYTLTARNDGPGVAKDVVITDALPAGVTYVAASESTCHVTSGVLSCLVGDLAAGEESTVDVQTTVDAVAAATGSETHQLDVTKVETHLAVPAGGTATAQADCPSGYLATDGSVRLDDLDQGTGSIADTEVLTSTATADGTGWIGTVRNPATGQFQGKVEVVCLSARTVSGEDHQHPVVVSAAVTSHVAAAAGIASTDLACGPGQVAIAPGWQITDGVAHVTTSRRDGDLDGTGWTFGATIPDHVEGTVSIRCLSTTLGVAQGHTHALRLTQLRDTVTVPAGQTVQAQLTCADEAKGIVASWAVDPGLVFRGTDPQPKTRLFRFTNPTGATLQARIGLLCLETRTTAELGLTQVVNTATVTTSSPDATTDDDTASATVDIAPASSGTVVCTSSRARVDDAARRVVLTLRAATAKRATVTVRAAGTGGGVHRGDLLGHRAVRLGAGEHRVGIPLRAAVRKAVRTGRIDRVQVVVRTADGASASRTLRLG